MDISVELLVFIILGLAVIAILVVYISKMASSASKIDSATRWLKANDNNKAISILKTIIAKNDSHSQAHYLLGECYFLNENFEHALPEYKKVLRINKYEKDFNEAMVRRRVANVYLYYKQLEEAQKEFLLVTKLEPNKHENYYEIGRIFVERDHVDKALPYFQKALEMNPNHSKSLFYAGMIKFIMKLYSESLLHLEKCIALDKQFFKAYYYIGMINYQSKNLQASLQNFDLSSRDKEYRIRSLFQRGIIYMESKDLNQGIVEFEKAISYITEEDNVTRNIRYRLAQCHEIQKNITVAIEQWELIMKSQPNFRDVHEKLANYSELRMDDKLKDFFIASNDAFEQMSRKILKHMNIDVKEVNDIKSTSVEFIANERFGNKDIRVQKVLVRIYRYNEPLTDRVVRDIAEIYKKEGAVKAYCISATGFSKQAVDYANTRPIHLVSGKELAHLLREIR